MTNHIARLYALATSLVVFVAVWLAVSAHPWAQSSAALPANTPQMARLAAREHHLRAETRRVNLIVERRFAAYRRALAAVAQRTVVAQSPVAAPPAVRVVTLPPVASTRTS
jgi:hypothetical protein